MLSTNKLMKKPVYVPMDTSMSQHPQPQVVHEVVMA